MGKKYLLMLLALSLIPYAFISCTQGDREQALGVISVERFIEDVSPNRRSSVGMVGTLEFINSRYVIIGDESQIVLLINERECISNLIGYRVFISFSPSKHYDSPEQSMSDFYFIRRDSHEDYDRSTMLCAGSVQSVDES